MFLNYEYKKGAKLYIHKSSWTGKTTFLYFSFMLFCWCSEEKTTIANNGNKFRKNKNFFFLHPINTYIKFTQMAS